MGNKKKCRACLEEKELYEFRLNTHNDDGYSSKCKLCYKNKITELTGESKPCNACGIVKDLGKFPLKKGDKNKRQDRCKECKKNKILPIKEPIFTENKRRCSVCTEYKDFSEYSKCINCNQGIYGRCKKCESVISKKYRFENKDSLKEAKHQEYLKNAEIYKERSKKYSRNNRQRLNETRKIWKKNKIDNDPLYKLNTDIKRVIWISFNKGLLGKIVKTSKSIDILGCSIEDFKVHIEKQFLPWMNWGNHGNCEINDYDCSWDLDHIVPISYAKNQKEVYLLNHWSNFQPLCSKVNRNEKRDNLYPLTNIELKITFINDKNEFTTDI